MSDFTQSGAWGRLTANVRQLNKQVRTLQVAVITCVVACLILFFKVLT